MVTDQSAPFELLEEPKAAGVDVVEVCPQFRSRLEVRNGNAEDPHPRVAAPDDADVDLRSVELHG